MPIVDLLLARTIAFDFTKRHTLNANIKLSNCDLEGFLFETILNFFLEKSLLSSDWSNVKLLIEYDLKISSNVIFDESMSLRFFLTFNILSAFLSNPLAIITSKNFFFN